MKSKIYIWIYLQLIRLHSHTVWPHTQYPIIRLLTIHVTFLPSNSKTIVNLIPNTVKSMSLCVHIYSIFIKNNLPEVFKSSHQIEIFLLRMQSIYFYITHLLDRLVSIMPRLTKFHSHIKVFNFSSTTCVW